MRNSNVATIIGGVLLLASIYGCASPAALESRQLAYKGSGPNPCLFGGVSDAAQQHCQQVRWGSQGLLMAINAKAVKGLSQVDEDRPCQEHVARVERELLKYPLFKSQRIYSCPDGGSPNCHVSLLVADAANRMFVLDNGAVLSDANFAASVAQLDEFSARLGEVYWIGSLPENARQIASAARR